MRPVVKIAPAARSYPNTTQAPIPRAIRTTASRQTMTHPIQKRRPSRQHSRQGLRQRLERARELYLRHCFEKRKPARANEFAEKHLRLTRPYLSRVVPEALDMPLRDFLRERQLAEAQRLLETTTLSIVQVARASAFGTHPTFYRCFIAAFGMTPGEYRKQVTK